MYSLGSVRPLCARADDEPSLPKATDEYAPFFPTRLLGSTRHDRPFNPMLGWRRIALLGLLLGWATCGTSDKGNGPEPVVEPESEPKWKWTCTATATGTDRLFGAQVSGTFSMSADTEAEAREDLQETVCLIYKDCGQLQSVSCDEQGE